MKNDIDFNELINLNDRLNSVLENPTFIIDSVFCKV